MEIGVRVEAEDPLSGNKVHCCSAYLTFVALDAFGKPKKVPTLDVTGNECFERRAEEAQMRKENRLRIKALRSNDMT